MKVCIVDITNENKNLLEWGQKSKKLTNTVKLAADSDCHMLH